MKVVYLKNYGGNKRGDVKEAAEGFVRNFLLPQGIAVVATTENINKIKKELEQQSQQKRSVVSGAQIMAEKIRNKRIEIKGRANEAGKLYAAVSEDDIKKELKRLGYNIDEAKVLGHHLKEAGDYDVKVDFGHGINSNIKIAVRV